jgi:hypothetical protein
MGYRGALKKRRITWPLWIGLLVGFALGSELSYQTYRFGRSDFSMSGRQANELALNAWRDVAFVPSLFKPTPGVYEVTWGMLAFVCVFNGGFIGAIGGFIGWKIDRRKLRLASQGPR